MTKTIAFGLALALAACGGESSTDATGGSAGTSGSGGSSSGGVGGSSGGTGAVAGSAGTGAVAGSGGTGVDACHDPALKACTGPGQCALATSDCCLCGMPEITDYVAMTQAAAGQCTCQGPICDCVSVDNPNLAASCESGQCAAWDVRKRDDYSGCTLDSDCQLRNGLDCCEACQAPAENLVAVRSDAYAALKAAMCSASDVCSKCMVQYPPNAAATCNAGHCQVVFAK